MKAILAISAFALGLALGVAPEAKPIVCQTYKGSDGYYAWRVVDGKRCWYRGARRMSKAKLAWVHEAPKRSRPVKMIGGVMFQDCLQVRGDGCDKLLTTGGLIDSKAYMDEFVRELRGEQSVPRTDEP